MPDMRHDPDLGGEPQPSGGTDADEPGVEAAARGGAVPGHPGPGGGGGRQGSADLAGDADVDAGGAGTEDDPLRTQTAGGKQGQP